MEGQRVECHSGYTFAQRPTTVHWEGQRLSVKTILSEHHSPEGKTFHVLTEDGSSFNLTYHSGVKTWQIVKC